MNPNLERGLLLFQQSRHELAENELRQALASDPHDAHAHALLALCLAERKQFKEATEEARQAIHLAPDFSFVHYTHARVLCDRNRYQEARTAIEEAIALDPEDADYHALLAGIHFDERRWQEALSSAERGLQSDPEHVGCNNLRAMALVKLGRREQAGATIGATLAKNPQDSVTHANQGWTLLEHGDHKKALEHFQESLRIDPENEWARQGIVEALKARNIIYAVMLKYFLWMARLSPRAQWGIILGGYFGSRMLGAAAKSNPDLAPWVLPVRVIYVIFVLMTWTADPLFNLLLRLNRYGRLALSREQIVASNWIGACLLVAGVGLIACGFSGFKFTNPWMLITAVAGFLVIPVAGTFKCEPGWPRKAMGAYTAAMAAAGIIGVICFSIGSTAVGQTKILEVVGLGFLLVFLIGAMGSPWAANILMQMRPKR